MSMHTDNLTQVTTEALASQTAARLAPQYVADFQKLMAGMHPAALAHPDTQLVCADKFEQAAFRAMLDATGYGHVVIVVKERKPSRRQRRKLGVDFRSNNAQPQNN